MTFRLSRLLAASALAACCVSLAGCATVPAADTALSLEVSKDCGERPRCHATLGTALQAAAAEPAARPVRIAVGPGNFNERVVAERSNLSITGAGRDRTRLHHDLVAEHAVAMHRDRWGTAGSATLTITGSDVAIADLTVENDFDYLANDALPSGDPRKIGNSQGIIFDSALLQLARLQVGDEVNVEVHAGGTITITPLVSMPPKEDVSALIKDTMKQYARTMKRLA